MKQIALVFFPFMLLAQGYTFVGPSQNVVQIVASKVLYKAYARAGIPIKITFLPPAESLRLTNAGRRDGELARIKNISLTHKNLLIIPVILGHVEAVAFSKNPNIHIKKWSDLNGYDFTIVKGAKFIEKGTQDLKKHYVNTFLEAFEKLANDETQIIVIPKKAVIRFAIQKKYHDIKPVSHSLKRLAMYHFVHTKNAHLIPIITPILQKMKRSGEIEYIRNSYLRGLTH